MAQDARWTHRPSWACKGYTYPGRASCSCAKPTEALSHVPVVVLCLLSPESQTPKFTELLQFRSYAQISGDSFKLERRWGHCRNISASLTHPAELDQAMAGGYTDTIQGHRFASLWSVTPSWDRASGSCHISIHLHHLSTIYALSRHVISHHLSSSVLWHRRDVSVYSQEFLRVPAFLYLKFFTTRWSHEDWIAECDQALWRGSGHSNKTANG